MKTLMLSLVCLSALVIHAQAQSQPQAQPLTQTQRLLTPQALRMDLSILRQSLEEIHPQLHRYSDQAALDRAFTTLEDDVRQGMTEGEFFRRVSQITTLIRCGHTWPNPLNQDAGLIERVFNQQHLLPFYFRWVDRRMIVTHNVSGNSRVKAGTEILTINSVPVSQILETLLSVSKADGLNTTAHRVRMLEVRRSPSEADVYENLFDIYYPLFFPLPKPSFDVEAVDFPTQSKWRLKTPALTKQQRVQLAQERFGKVPSREESWQFNFLENDLAHLKLGTFFTFGWQLDTKKFLADAFAEMRRRNTRALIVDLRGNAGGLTQHAEELKRFLAKRPLECRNGVRRAVKNTRFDRSLAPFLSSAEAVLNLALQQDLPQQLFRKRDDGMFEILGEGECATIQPDTNSFRGKVYFLSDAVNASAVFQLLSDVKFYGLGTIVGQETGGNLQGINSSIFFLRLPNSKIEVDLPVIASLPVQAQADSGIKPDFSVRPSAHDIAQGVDAEVAFVRRQTHPR